MSDDQWPDTRTLPRDPSVGWDRFERWLRIIAVIAVFGVVGYAAFGCAGPTTATTSASQGELAVEVRYASVSRPGMPSPFVVDVHTVDGSSLPAKVDVEVPRPYLSMFDENGLDPAPDSIAADDSTEVWTFATDGRSVLVIDFDARLQPNIHTGRTGWVEVTAGSDTARVEFHTRVLP